MKSIVVSLEALAAAVDKNSDLSKTEEAIKATRSLIKGFVGAGLPRPTQDAGTAPLHELDAELSIWQSKLAVILKEPVGKKGMAKHARYWAEKLKMSNQ